MPRPGTASGEMLALDIARQAVDLTGKTILPLDFTMERDRSIRRSAHETAAAQLEPYLHAGQDVALLNLGDVSIYATFGYLQSILQDRGYPTVMIPGIPSFCAVAARLNSGLTEMNQPLHIVPAGSGSLDGTLALPARNPDEIRQPPFAGRGDPAPNRPAAQGRYGPKLRSAGEQVYVTLEDLPKTTGYFATIVVKE